MDTNIKVILFDLGRVLMHIDFENFPNGLGLKINEERMQFDHAKIQKSVRMYETGNISTNEFLDSLYEIFQHKYSRNKILEAYNGIIVADNFEIIPFVEEAARRYRIAVLSNTCPCHWEKVLRVSSLIKIFPEVFTSFHLGAMKPESIVYEKVCASLNVQPHEVLFIDDLKENVEGAISAGMKGIIFSSALQLQNDFKNQTW